MSDIKPKAVSQRPDGFWSVEGQSEDTYYATKEIAERVATNLAIRDAANQAAKGG